MSTEGVNRLPADGEIKTIERPESWGPRHERILIMRSRGSTNKYIADKLHLELQHVTKISSGDYFKQQLAILHEKRLARTIEKEVDNASTRIVLDKARKILELHAETAAKKIRQISKEGVGTQRIQFDACRDILDRVGIKGKEIIENVSRPYTPEEITSAKETLLEVESITARVTKATNKFVLPKPDEPVSTPTGQAIDVTTGTTETGSLGQETVPEKPVLPL